MVVACEVELFLVVIAALIFRDLDHDCNRSLTCFSSVQDRIFSWQGTDKFFFSSVDDRFFPFGNLYFVISRSKGLRSWKL